MEKSTQNLNPLNNLEILKFSKAFAVATIREVIKMKEFSFRDQITRSILSIPSNIAEGYGRFSDKEFIRFLRIAVGSTYEAETQILIANDINLLDLDLEKTQSDLKKIRIMLFKLIQSIERRVKIDD